MKTHLLTACAWAAGLAMSASVMAQSTQNTKFVAAAVPDRKSVV